jgi:hypothetical protein
VIPEGGAWIRPTTLIAVHQINAVHIAHEARPKSPLETEMSKIWAGMKVGPRLLHVTIRLSLDSAIIADRPQAVEAED